ncbi:MAG: AGE family epimerase/isomerase [Phyllobacteriaceae bacterium]|nr:AGE family epimerase/isomerase [Phyllobacteriaceae bacterium]
MTSQIQPVILCGGIGSRLWPLSTALHPKQFLPLISPQSMLAMTAGRVGDPALFAPPVIVGGLRYKSLMQQAVPDARLIVEPFGRNSAAAIAAAALLADDDTVQLVLPADHNIADITAFMRALAIGRAEADKGRIITFGIEPDHPATGYGYIEAETTAGDTAPVRRFIEKPDRPTAESLLARGGHYWNAGIFMFRADVMRSALRAHADDILKNVEAALEPADGANGAISLNADRFARCRSESIDYAVMEKADNISVVPVSMGWSDVGDHAALASVVQAAEASGAQGPVVAEASGNCFVRSDGPTVGLYGVTDLAVVASRDAVLVTQLDRAADIKPLVERVEERAVNAQVAPAVRARIGAWLYDTLLPHWLERAWDEQGGFVEALDSDGAPLAGHPRRGRVAPRQVFAFSEAVLQGWNPDGAAAALIERGIDYLDRHARSPRGGWASLIAPGNTITDDSRALYDHSFVAMAGAHAYRATGYRPALDIAREAFEFIDGPCRAVDGTGWFDPDGDGAARLANPHMHLLEASLIMFDATADAGALERAQTIATLFEDHMFSGATGAMFEEFDAGWSVQPDAGRARIEPGHCYEWAYLLKRLDRLAGRDTRSWCNRLVAFADRAGVGPHGRVLNAVTGSGDVIDANARLWPQLERIRAKLHIAEASAPGAVDGLISGVFEDYVVPAAPGLWRDELDGEGRSLRPQVPASMLYHFATAFAPIADPAAAAPR